MKTIIRRVFHVSVFVFPVWTFLDCRGTEYYLQNAEVTHLPPNVSPRLVSEYQPKKMNLMLSGTLTPPEPLSFNNGEHSKVNSAGIFEFDTQTADTYYPGLYPSPANTCEFAGNNVSWDMSGFKGAASLTYDFARFGSMVADIQLGGNRSSFNYDVFVGCSFRFRGAIGGVRSELGGGLKGYSYSAEVVRYDWDYSGYDSYDNINQDTCSRFLSMPYIQYGFLSNGDFGSPVGAFIRGYFRYSPNLFSRTNENDWTLFNTSGAHLSIISIVAGTGVYAMFSGYTLYFATDLLFPWSAKKIGLYPVSSFGIGRDFMLGRERNSK
ncbi:MAG: hypothetical protein JW913_11015 [Chitinispirillaceae bacterium]|nr:hypothetical protein [Chitinispirillaceae bacterium]